MTPKPPLTVSKLLFDRPTEWKKKTQGIPMYWKNVSRRELSERIRMQSTGSADKLYSSTKNQGNPREQKTPQKREDREKSPTIQKELWNTQRQKANQKSLLARKLENNNQH